MRYEIYVDNIGRATDTWDKEQAIADFNHYVEYVSKGETVSFFMGDELIAQYYDGEILGKNFVKTDGRYITGFTEGYKREFEIVGVSEHGFFITNRSGLKIIDDLKEEIVEQFPEIINYDWVIVLLPTLELVLEGSEEIPFYLLESINNYIYDTTRVIDKRQ